MNPIPWQTPEEAEFIKESVLLPILLDVLERDRAAILRAELKLPELYGELIEVLQNRVTADLSLVRQGMRKHGMKVYEERRTTLGIEASYLCRGYHYEFSMLWGLVKAEILQRLRRYLKIQPVKEGNRS